MYTVFGDVRSGNCYKVKLLLEQLGLGYRWEPIDMLTGETRTPQFLAKNSNGQVPVIELPTGEYLAESNAILCYLAEGTRLLPEERLARARILQWLFFEQYTHERNIGGARYIVHYLKTPFRQRPALKDKQARGHEALAVMEQRLVREEYLAGVIYTIADIALYAHTHLAHEGGFDLSQYPGIQAWLERVRSQPDHVTMG